MQTLSTPTKCTSCKLREICMPVGLTSQQMALIDHMVSTRVKIFRGKDLFRAGAKFKSLYVVRTGFFKTTVGTADGLEQVSGFYMPGELMGLDGIVQSQYACSAVALEDSDVCVLHMDELNSVGKAIPELQQHVQKIMSREIVRDHDLFLMLGSMRSDGRIASFLINLLARLQVRGQSGDAVHLRMTREDIGSYLGLTIETVSRTLNKLARNGVISLEQKDIRVIDFPALHDLTQREDHKHCVQHALHTPLSSVATTLKQGKISFA